MNELYNMAVANIENILKIRYKLNVLEAKQAIEEFPLKELFIKDAEMAAHTSNEAWARLIHEM